MTYLEFKEAVARHREQDGKDGTDERLFRHTWDSALISRCLLSREPITAEGLKACGFESTTLPHTLTFADRIRVIFRSDWVLANILVDGVTANPQPRHMNQIYFLMMSLGYDE